MKIATHVSTESPFGWRRTCFLIAALLGCLVTTHLAANGSNDVPYPKGFRKWAHVKTVLVGPQSPFFQDSGGIHHIYANQQAMEGYATGEFPDGSVLVFELLGTKEKDGVTAEGDRQRVDVMLKNSKRFASTGGWGFERFVGDSETDRPLTEEHRGACFTCHEQAKDYDFVFSRYRKQVSSREFGHKCRWHPETLSTRI